MQLLLARRVVAHDRMDVAVDQPGGKRNAIRVDDGVGIIDVQILLESEGLDPPADGDNAVSVQHRLFDLSR